MIRWCQYRIFTCRSKSRFGQGRLTTLRGGVKEVAIRHVHRKCRWYIWSCLFHWSAASYSYVILVFEFHPLLTTIPALFLSLLAVQCCSNKANLVESQAHLTQSHPQCFSRTQRFRWPTRCVISYLVSLTPSGSDFRAAHALSNPREAFGDRAVGFE
jgi:hypothetical protein